MCLICLEWEKGKMTSKEAMRAMGESTESTEHLLKLTERILDKDVPAGTAPDPELDAEWERKNHGSD